MYYGMHFTYYFFICPTPPGLVSSPSPLTPLPTTPNITDSGALKSREVGETPIEVEALIL
jgi:hypothetical protein